jgi:hypothetical protein
VIRIPLDPLPLVLGIYAHVGTLLARASDRRQDDAPATLARRYARQRAQAGDKEVQRLVRALHSDVKTADKLLKKLGDVWTISEETDLVDLVVLGRGEQPEPRSYVLLRADEVRALLRSIHEAAAAAEESKESLEALEKVAASIDGKASDYITFGFDPWGQ